MTSADMTDQEARDFVNMLYLRYCPDMPRPKTMVGMRLTVDAFLYYERISPASLTDLKWALYSPVQP